MKTTENGAKNAEKAAILYAYNVLRIKNLVKSQKDFANLIGYDQQTISSAMRGREQYITPNLMRKLSQVMQDEYGINIYAAGDIQNAIANNNVQGDQKILGSQDTEKIVQTLTQEMAAQREQYAAQFDRLFNMLEREQSRTAELIKRLQ